MSRILFWSPNYAPELTGIAALVTDTAEWLAGRGHEVDVVAPMPNYPERRIHREYRGALWRHERRGLVRVHRSWLRVRPQERFADKLLYEASYANASLPLVLRRLNRVDALVCVVPSLLAAVYGSIAARALGVFGRRWRYIVWVQDLVLNAGSSVRGVGSIAQEVLARARALERAAAGGADAVVVCSSGFRAHLAALGVDPDRIVTIYNGVDPARFVSAPPLDGKERIRLLYSGNLGYTQDFQTLIGAVRNHDGVELTIMGEGNEAPEVRRLAAKERNVIVSPTVAREVWPGVLAEADAFVLAQRRGVAVANLPSKLGPYLATGRPIVAALDLDSPAAELLRSSGAALLVAPENPGDLRRALGEVAASEALRTELGKRGREFAERELAPEATVARLESVILGDSAVPPRPATGKGT